MPDLPHQVSDAEVVPGNGLRINRKTPLWKLVDANATIAVPDLEAGSQIEVIDESRTLRSDTGRFTDRFAPLAVHIYRLSESAGDSRP